MADKRASIKATAKEHGWTIPEEQLDDRHIVRRMVLKKCVFGVDKNAMAVELAKTALWLHTFTVGAPLSFLDHHLRTGDSLHGERVETVQRGLQAFGGLFKQNDWQRLAMAAKNIAQVADLTDADIAEAHLSKELNEIAQREIAPIQNVLDFWRAMRWLIAGWPVAKIDQLPRLMGLPKDRQAAQTLLDKDSQSDSPQYVHYRALQTLLSPEHDLVELLGQDYIEFCGADGKRDNTTTDLVDSLISHVRRLAKSETFFHWWTSFPTVFGSQQGADTNMGFDAVIGNPPWDRIKLQEVEWFAERVEAVAMASRASDRKALIAKLKAEQSPLYAEYLEAQWRAEANARVLGNGKQGSEDYPLLGGGDVNLYSLFIERAQSLVKPTGLVALITPSGIAADKGASEFFKSISTTQRLGAFFDFENKKFFFKDVHASFKFCALIFGGFERTLCSVRPQRGGLVHSRRP
jgi:Eco57I restriction-modification methylase